MPIRRSYALAALLASALLVLAAATPAGAQDERLDRAGQRLFNNYTRVFCQQFFKYEDQFVLLPNYYREREASTGKTYDQVEEELTETRVERRGGGVIRHITIPPPPGEVVAEAMVIPAIDVGHYGHVDAVTVVRVVRDNEMIVKDIRLIDPAHVAGGVNTRRQALVERQKEYIDRTYRLHGFPTEGLEPGQLYRGPRDAGLHVAVAGADQHHNFVLVNYDRLERIRTREFADALAYVDISPAEFNEMVRGNREEHRSQGDKRSLIHIYRLYYTTFRVPRPAAAPGSSPGRVPDNSPPTRDPEPTPGNAPADPPPGNVPADPPPGNAPGNVPGNAPADPPADDNWRDNDDWDDDWTPPPPPDDPNFFGIPLD